MLGPGGGVLRGLSTFTRVGVQSVVSGVALALVGADCVDAHRIAVAVVAELAALRRTLVDVCTHIRTSTEIMKMNTLAFVLIVALTSM